jgi:type VI secretion system protein ImpG
MNREFLDLYNRELDLFYEHAAEFAEEYPEIAKRLGGLIRDRTDPMAAGLLEGAAFLAARVQLKIKHEFPEFANNLLEQLVPHYLAPTPSAMLVKALPKYGDSALADGRLFPRGSQIDATYLEADKEIACRYTLTAPIRLWPFYIKSADYFYQRRRAAAAQDQCAPRDGRRHAHHARRRRDIGPDGRCARKGCAAAALVAVQRQ